MSVCDYGCGQEATYEFKNGKKCCATNQGKCPAIIDKRRESRKGYTHSPETRLKLRDARLGLKLTDEWKNNISKAGKGRINGPLSDETKKKISESRKGIEPWNKGKTAESDDRIRMYAEKQRGQKRIGKYVANKDWSGENNPWYGKNRSKENSPRYNGERKNREFRDYRNQVDFLTRKTYEKYEQIINPNGYERVRAGLDGYQLDHIVSVKYGFEHNIPVELIAHQDNLQMIPWNENVKKYDKVDESIIPDIIMEYLKNG